jgi:hypothetical protein
MPTDFMGSVGGTATQTEREIEGEEVVTEEYGIEVPACDFNDPASLEAWFGNYSFWDHYRKVVIANCMELIRAEYARTGEKVTETRLDALARTHDYYKAFLANGLMGRVAREQNVLQSLRHGS